MSESRVRARKRMDFSNNSFVNSVSLLSMSPENTTLEMSSLLTPPKKSLPPPLNMDEDSGLGMELDAESPGTPAFSRRQTANTPDTPSFWLSSQSYSVRRSLFKKSKRLSDGDAEGSITKKQKFGSGTGSSVMLTKSLSFGDQPLYQKVDERCDVRSAVERLVEEKDLIGNGTLSYCLPTIPGKHSDLKSITAATMTDLLAGRYDDVIGSYRIIDCRYPYEYDGGHIRSAENMFTKDKIMSLLDSRSRREDGKREILIFHCEFSSERGPKMSRFLRNKDRELNKDSYPYLNFPEVYLLHDGYKAFYESNKNYCEPMSYTPMLHKNHTDDLRHFRSKSKSWGGNRKRKEGHRLMF